VGAPLSTWIMDHVTAFGLSGWRWMLLLEGIPAVLGGAWCYFFLTDGPGQATWLSDAEKAWLTGELAKDHLQQTPVTTLSPWQAIAHPKVLQLALIYFVYQAGSLGVGYWMPQIIASLSGRRTNFEVGLIAVLPYAVATIAMILWSVHSDKTGERQSHSALPLLLAAITLGVTGFTRSPLPALLLIAAALAGLYAFKSPFWSLPGLFLSRSTAAVSIAAINSIGNLGGFVGPYLLGVTKSATGAPLGGLLFLSALLFAAFLLTQFGHFAVGPTRQ
jgi:ACS family tartrate transporter-like MFS transporter